MRLLVATGNAGKLREFRQMLEPLGFEVLGLGDLPDRPALPEDGDTFLENARAKAWPLARRLGIPVLADDSGLAVDALGGAPGVRSARFAGPGATDAQNNARLLAELRDVPDPGRTAAFVCALVLALPDLGEVAAEGRVAGRILREPRGTGGFGYDPLFLVEGLGRTAAELEPEVKNRVSHRGRALRLLLPVLRALGRGEL